MNQTNGITNSLINAVKQKIEESGLELTDERIVETIKALENYSYFEDTSLNQLEDLVCEHNYLVQRAFAGELVVPDWKDFKAGISEIFEEIKGIDSGSNASYIPALSEVDSNLLETANFNFVENNRSLSNSISACSIDGQRLDIGDFETNFCIQSCSKPFVYLMAMEEKGMDFVHHYVGKEPSGVAFNSLTLKKVCDPDGKERQIPHNSMINAGSIMCCSIIKNENKTFEDVSDVIARLCGKEKITISERVYKSEFTTADRNRCLSYMMREYKSFPNPNEDIEELLSFYFKCCSIEINTRDSAVLAASLANGGVCPLTNEPIFKSINVRSCLSQMLSCGLYDFSGEWSFSIGLPAKSGVSGCILIVIPNKLGIAVYSPKLDSMGNSVRGIAFANSLVKRFSIHHLDNLKTRKSKLESIARVITSKSKQHRQNVSMMLLAAARGDLGEVMRLISIGVNPFEPGVDKRTALHLAACENKKGVIRFLLSFAKSHGVPNEKVLTKDAFNNTPLDDAEREGLMDVVELFTGHFHENL